MKNFAKFIVVSICCGLGVVVTLRVEAQSLPTISESQISQNVATIMSDLKRGDRGEDVVNLQNFLISEKILVMPPDVSTGFFGDLTKKALSLFQTRNSLNVSGVLDKSTRDLIAKREFLDFKKISVSQTSNRNQILIDWKASDVSPFAVFLVHNDTGTITLLESEVHGTENFLQSYSYGSFHLAVDTEFLAEKIKTPFLDSYILKICNKSGCMDSKDFNIQSPYLTITNPSFSDNILIDSKNINVTWDFHGNVKPDSYTVTLYEKVPCYRSCEKKVMYTTDVSGTKKSASIPKPQFADTYSIFVEAIMKGKKIDSDFVAFAVVVSQN